MKKSIGCQDGILVYFQDLRSLIHGEMVFKPVHLICFIRDDVNFCLGLSLIFSNIFPSPVPYSSLIFQANLDRRLTRKCIQSPPRPGGRGQAKKQLTIVKKFYGFILLVIMYQTYVYISILLPDPQISPKSRIQVLKNLNWRKWFPTNFPNIIFS